MPTTAVLKPDLRQRHGGPKDWVGAMAGKTETYDRKAIATWMAYRGLSTDQAARVLGVAPDLVARMLAGDHPVPEAIARSVRTTQITEILAAKRSWLGRAWAHASTLVWQYDRLPLLIVQAAAFAWLAVLGALYAFMAYAFGELDNVFLLGTMLAIVLFILTPVSLAPTLFLSRLFWLCEPNHYAPRPQLWVDVIQITATALLVILLLPFMVSDLSSNMIATALMLGAYVTIGNLIWLWPLIRGRNPYNKSNWSNAVDG
jgi:hypothetical protein